ncbi:hypothetical protein B4589_002830 [Halolamina sp. CBA1230]|uniref:DUF7288 family protein n=1 Tax=Halolamina sp. CBA1230 TaxID=1853690 RepID=UPI0009A22B4A|nr:hypothetical protein [Halolamina sp. CBA1230]QKY19360.1 hypothetical protein B4589_002830 [Halolamina sp. CBA1230]
MVSDDRGQARALEAITAGMLLLASLAFALQVTAVTPLTGSTSSQHIENQQAKIAEGVLAAEAENGTVVPTLLAWNESGHFDGAEFGGFHGGGPPTAFGNVLDRTLRERNIAFNVNVFYVTSDGERNRRPLQLVDLGSPSDHASTATRSFTLYDDDVLHDIDESTERAEPTDTTLGEEDGNYFAPDIDGDSRLYNVVEVEVVVWRM